MCWGYINSRVNIKLRYEQAAIVCFRYRLRLRLIIKRKGRVRGSKSGGRWPHPLYLHIYWLKTCQIFPWLITEEWMKKENHFFNQYWERGFWNGILEMVRREDGWGWQWLWGKEKGSHRNYLLSREQWVCWVGEAKGYDSAQNSQVEPSGWTHRPQPVWAHHVLAAFYPSGRAPVNCLADKF